MNNKEQTGATDLDQEIDALLDTKPETKKKTTEESKPKKKQSKTKADTDKNEENENSAMAKLIKANPVKVPMEGEKITGKIIGVESLAVYVDLGSLGTGVVYGKDIRDGFGADRKKLDIGDEISAVILDLENDEDYVELSISEAVREEAWRDLRAKKADKTPLAVRITEANKGGLMTQVNGISGFLPVSQLTAEHYPRVEDGDKNKIFEILKSHIGKEMTVCVLDTDESEEKLIISEKEAYRGEEQKAISELKVGNIVEGIVSGVVDFGAFVKFLPPSKKDSDREEDKLEGLVHISQLDWQLIDDPRKVVRMGDTVKTKIIGIDDRRISLSIRALKDDPWAAAAGKYKAGDKVRGTVRKVNHFGAFVYLDKDIHGLAHVSSFPGPIEEVVKVGEEYDWEIMSLELNEHRMGLKYVDGKSKTPKKTTDSTDDKKEKEKEDNNKEEKKEETKEGKPKKKVTKKDEKDKKVVKKEKETKKDEKKDKEAKEKK